MKIGIKSIIICGIFAAITAVCAQIAIPVPFGVPFTLQLAAVFLCGMLLGPKKGFAAQVAYLLAGAAGLPVFANLHGGLAVFAGPTGGFLIAFPFIALLVGLMSKEEENSNFKLAASMLLGLLLCYSIGSLWFSYVMKTSIEKSMTIAVIPFIPTDLLKIAVVFPIGLRIKKSLLRTGLLH